MTLAFLDGWSFLAPAFLVLLLVPAVLAAAYFVQQRRHGRLTRYGFHRRAPRPGGP